MYCAWAACSDAVDNRTYLLDENDNACLGSWTIIEWYHATYFIIRLLVSNWKIIMQMKTFPSITWSRRDCFPNELRSTWSSCTTATRHPEPFATGTRYRERPSRTCLPSQDTASSVSPLIDWSNHRSTEHIPYGHTRAHPTPRSFRSGTAWWSGRRCVKKLALGSRDRVRHENNRALT